MIAFASRVPGEGSFMGENQNVVIPHFPDDKEETLALQISGFATVWSVLRRL